jgi:integrase
MGHPMGRAKGEGTGPFEIKLPSGTIHYRVAVTMADGRRVWRTRPTKRLAEQARKGLVEARELDLDPTRQTLGDYLRSWIASLRDARNRRVRPRTLETYGLVVERHIIPALGSLKLAAVTPRRVQAWLDATPLAARTVRLHHGVLRRALNIAVRQRLLPYNPASAVELPRSTRDVARPLTLDEARRLLDATRGDRLHALWRLALVTGLREGELLGLAWDDVDGATITVRSQLQRLDRAWVRTAPKAARTLVRVALDPATAAALDAHRVHMAQERTPSWSYFGLVFVTERGQPFHRPAILRRFHEACDAAGIERRRVHDLRHSTAHMLADLGVTMEARKARLGHTTDAMATHYSGASEVQDRLAVERLGEALG